MGCDCCKVDAPNVYEKCEKLKVFAETYHKKCSSPCCMFTLGTHNPKFFPKNKRIKKTK